MSMNGIPTEVRYKGVLYRLREAAESGLGSTREGDNFPIITKKYATEIRTLLYSGGAFILEVTLLWNFAPGVEVTIPTTLEEDDAALIFHALSRDGGTVSDKYKEIVEEGGVPEPVQKITSPLLSRRSEEPKQLTAGAKRVALLRWEGEKLLRVPPDEEVAKVVFHLCSPEEGFELCGLPYKNVPRDLVENFSHDLHVELMRMFPGATIDTQVVSSSDPHCGHPILLNKNSGPVKGYQAKVETLARDIWRQYYLEYQQAK